MSDLLQSIRRILWEDWDPIGVNDAAPDDEYDTYAIRVVAMIEQGRSEADVSAYLYWAAAGNMGLGGRGYDEAIREEARLVAQKIIALNRDDR